MERGRKKARLDSDDLMSLLSAQSAKEKADQKQRDEILELLGKPTAKEQENLEMFRNTSGNQLKQFCKHSTKPIKIFGFKQKLSLLKRLYQKWDLFYQTSLWDFLEIHMDSLMMGISAMWLILSADW